MVIYNTMDAKTAVLKELNERSKLKNLVGLSPVNNVAFSNLMVILKKKKDKQKDEKKKEEKKEEEKKEEKKEECEKKEKSGLRSLVLLGPHPMANVQFEADMSKQVYSDNVN